VTLNDSRHQSAWGEKQELDGSEVRSEKEELEKGEANPIEVDESEWLLVEVKNGEY
jgi:hypothetical protein